MKVLAIEIYMPKGETASCAFLWSVLETYKMNYVDVWALFWTRLSIPVPHLDPSYDLYQYGRRMVSTRY